MTRPLHYLFLLIFVFACTLNAVAQNPKQSAKKVKAAKKSSRKKGEAYTPHYIEKDSDEDGVPDGRDKCVNTPKGEVVTPFGCPMDADFDGVFDYEDACVDVVGPRENYGCPWEDKDNDGVLDNVDKCPTVAGIARYEGCPDTDKDGLPDYEDRCPQDRGPRVNNGCPYGDRDSDGVADNLDLCPDVFGVAHNRGCPEEKPEVQEVLKKAFDNLLFETGKDVIMASSFPSLNELAAVMQKYPNAKLFLEGHTDDVGDDMSNQLLSENRAKAVKNYLIERGVSEDRLSSAGFGETMPKATNDTDEGRQLNRRVEMNIVYD